MYMYILVYSLHLLHDIPIITISKVTEAGAKTKQKNSPSQQLSIYMYMYW